jgi:AcrR family transcriptional regulator
MNQLQGSEDPHLDGRRARRKRNAEDVLDVVHDLFVETHDLPTMEEVAARSGVSLRSVYRYFPDTRQMLLAAMARRVRAMEPTWQLPHLGEASFEERLTTFVDHRFVLYETSAPTFRAAYAVRARVDEIAEQIDVRRRQVDAQARRHFAEDLRGQSPSAVKEILACIEVLAGFEAMETLHAHRGLSPAASRRVILRGLRAVLPHPG